MTHAWLAVLCVAAAAALWCPRPISTGRPGRPRSPVLAVATAAASGAALVGVAPPEVVVLSLVGAATTVGGVALARQRNRRRVAHRARARVLEVCEQLAGDLAVGQPPGQALQRAAVQWPPLEPVAESFRVGADVPAAWREVGRQPGAGDLRLVAAAWQVAHRSGHGLADAVDRVAREIRSAQGTRRIVEGELASARATSRLVAGLPVLALMMGSGAGGDPWSFLLGHPVGWACLGAGMSFALLGLWWIEAIARDVDRR